MATGAELPVDSREMGVIETNSVALGVSLDTLMENAGRAVAEEAVRHLPPAPARVGVVCGTGNNGGDGFCAAFYLHQWGYSPEVWVVRPVQEIRPGSAQRCYDRIADRLPVHVAVPRDIELRDLPLVLDALLGTGQGGTLRTPFREAVAALVHSGAPILSVDVPTGLGQSGALVPRYTVALGAVKVGMTAANSGELCVRDIGIPPTARWETGPGDFLDFPTPESRGRRGRSGRLVVLGGGPYAGAPALAALAALRAGAERATVLAPRPASDRIQGFSPDLVVRGIGEEHFRRRDVPAIREALRQTPPKALVMGMGAGSDPETVGALKEVLEWVMGRFPVVVDADALLALDLSARAAQDRPASELVATPNDGEYTRLFGGESNEATEDRVPRVREVAGTSHLTLLVKGEVDLISDGLELYRNRHHHPAMTVGGLGDVLAGVVGALLAQGVPAVRAARLGSYWAGEAGTRVAETKGFGLVATDVIAELPATLVDGIRRVRAGR